MRQIFLAIALLAFAFSATAKKEFVEHNNLMDHGDGHLMNMDGAMIMGQNTDTLPGGCDRIAKVEEITVRGGHKYAQKFPGAMFAFDRQEYQFAPCTKLTVHFINDDDIRHQFMLHGLPKYLYPKGMFHLEITGPGKISGTLIFPPSDKTYLLHCDIAQHMEKGMKGQIKIGKGNGDLPSILGITANVIQDDYSTSIPEAITITAKKPANGVTPSNNNEIFLGAGLLLGILLMSLLLYWAKSEFTTKPVLAFVTALLNYNKKLLQKIIKTPGK